MQLSLFSVSFAGYWGQHALDLPAYIAHASQLGYRRVTLAGKRPHLSPLDTGLELLSQIQTALREQGVACAAIAGYTDLSPTAAAEVPYLEMQIAYVESLARLARELGAGVVRVFTAYEAPGRNPNGLWRDAVTVLREMADRAAAYGVALAVQNHHDIGVETQVLLELLHDIDRPNCRLGFDAWSPALRGEDLYSAARQAAPFTLMTTNADYVRLPRFHYRPEFINYERAQPDMVRAVPFGEGFIDYAAFFSGLRDGGFSGPANYEMCSPVRGGGELSNLDAYCRRYIEWMTRNGFAKPGDGLQ